MNDHKKAGRSNGVVNETAEFHINRKIYEKNFDKIFNNEPKREYKQEIIDKNYYYINILFKSDQAIVKTIEYDESNDEQLNIIYVAVLNGAENKCSVETFLKYWKISKIRV